jgi:RNA polymerase sigma-70 factor (ECF subfamily)
MNSATPRLSLISTLWSLVDRANAQAEVASSAREQLFERYEEAIRRYLRRVLHNPDAADEVMQQFALRLVRGDLRGANPRVGRFRNFVKGTLFHLVADYYRQQRKWPRPLPADAAVAGPLDAAASDRQFEESWRDELLARAWAALAEAESRSGQDWYTVLRYRADHPEMRSPQMAAQLSSQLGRPITAAGVRQTLHRAREKFAEFLVAEVRRSLQEPTREEVEQELADLGLIDYCRPALTNDHARP